MGREKSWSPTPSLIGSAGSEERERDGKRVQERERERREPPSPSVIGSAVVVTR